MSNPSFGQVLKTPKLIWKVVGEADDDTLKARTDVIREIFRELQYCQVLLIEEINQFMATIGKTRHSWTDQDAVEWFQEYLIQGGDDEIQPYVLETVFHNMLEPPGWIEAYLIKLFPQNETLQEIIRHACYVEMKIAPFPFNPMPVWVTVPVKELQRLIIGAMRAGESQPNVLTLITLYLWFEHEGDREFYKKAKKITHYKISQLYNSSGMDKRTVIKCLKNLGINFQSTSVPIGKDKFENKTVIKIARSNRFKRYITKIPEFELVNVVDASKSHQDLQQSETLLERLDEYLWYFPPDNGGLILKTIPVVIVSGEYIRVPLIKGIASIMMLAALSEDILIKIGKQGKNTYYRKYEKIVSDANEALAQINKRMLIFARHSRDVRERDHFRAEIQPVLASMSVNGMRVDRDKLDSTAIDRSLPRREATPTETFEKYKESLIGSIAADGRLYYRYKHNSRTGRTSTNNFNIQGLWSEFKPAMLADLDHKFIYFDVVSHDLTMLFGLAADSVGIELLQNNSDPYQHLADTSGISGLTRDQVKAFFNPFLYGAGDAAIVSKCSRSEREVRRLKRAFMYEFRTSYEWIEEIVEDIKEFGMIRESNNPFGNEPIPMVKASARQAGIPSLIQRKGAEYFAHIIRSIQNELNSSHLTVYVHDSFIFQYPADHAEEYVNGKLPILLDSARSSCSLPTVNVKCGIGSTWMEAEKQSTLICLPVR